MFFGLRCDVPPHPLNDASYPVSVRQCRRLQSRLLQCKAHAKPPCDLLILPGVTPANKGLAPSGSFIQFLEEKIYIYHSRRTQQICAKMADGGLRYFISYLLNLVLAENGTANNAISAQIFKTLWCILI